MYDNVVHDNFSQNLKDQLDKVQNEAAGIVTGCTKVVEISDLYKEEETGAICYIFSFFVNKKCQYLYIQTILILKQTISIEAKYDQSYANKS